MNFFQTLLTDSWEFTKKEKNSRSLSSLRHVKTDGFCMMAASPTLSTRHHVLREADKRQKLALLRKDQCRKTKNCDRLHAL